MKRSDFNLHDYDNYKSHSNGLNVIYYLRKGVNYFKAIFYYKSRKGGEMDDTGDWSDINSDDYDSGNGVEL